MSPSNPGRFSHYIHVDPDNYIRIDKKRAEEIAKEEGFYNESLNMSTDW